VPACLSLETFRAERFVRPSRAGTVRWPNSQGFILGYMRYVPPGRLLPEGGNENSPGWSPPTRTEPWDSVRTMCRPPRRAGRNSAPDVSRIVFDAVLLQEREELGLEIALLMMLLLARDIRNRGGDLCPPDRERAVTLLPFEFVVRACLVHPQRRRAFDFSHGLGNRHGRRKRKQNVNVILGAAHRKSCYAMFSCDAAHVSPKSILNLRHDDRAPLLGREDTMEQRGAIRV